MKITFEIENLSCGGCVKTVTNGIEQLEGISVVNVSLENKTLSYESNSENADEIVEAKLKELGYPKKDENSLLNKAKSYFNK